MSGLPPTSENLRAAGKAALIRRRQRRSLRRTESDAPQPGPIEHYHLVYFHPRTETVSTDWATRYDRQRDAFLALRAVAEQAEPNVTYYEDGQVGFETRLHGMLGQHWMLAAVGMCTKRPCTPSRPIIEILTRL